VALADQLSDQIGPEYLATTRVSIILWEKAVEEELVGAARGERQGGDGGEIVLEPSNHLTQRISMQRRQIHNDIMPTTIPRY